MSAHFLSKEGESELARSNKKVKDVCHVDFDSHMNDSPTFPFRLGREMEYILYPSGINWWEKYLVHTPRRLTSLSIWMMMRTQCNVPSVKKKKKKKEKDQIVGSHVLPT